MGLLQRLEMRQGQSLVMTPQLLQAIKLLQLSHLELAAYVEVELERNPLLERPETEAAQDGGSDSWSGDDAQQGLDGEGDETPGEELCSSIAGLPGLFANFRSPCQSRDSVTMCRPMRPFGRAPGARGSTSTAARAPVPRAWCGLPPGARAHPAPC